jgi:DNA polymerase (family 10)
MSGLSNAEIAQVLDRYGRLLEIAGESGFRTRAYQRAAEAVRYYPEGVATLAQSGALRQIEGVGPGIASMIDELVRTGHLKALHDLERQVPPSLLELTEVPGLGAKSVARLHVELGIVDLAGLEATAQAGTIRSLPGFTEKSEARILAGIASLQRRTGRYRLGSVLPVGRRLVAELGDRLPANSSVSLAGSVRRMEETVAGLDLVVGTDHPDQAIAVIDALSSVATREDREGEVIRYLLHDGISLTAFVVPNARFGSELVRATGNAEHLAKLGEVAATGSEEEVYGRLGLPVVPAELRQGLDEFDLARRGLIDALVKVEDVRGEFHCHTVWSDGALSVDQTARAAHDHGYEFLGISDHTRSLGVANGLDVARLRAQRREIDEANRRSGIRVFASAEVEVSRDGRLDFDNPTLASLDVVIASTHVGLRQPRETLTERLLGVLDNRHVDVIAHPSGRLLEQREGGDFDWDRVFATAARTGTALEINADPARLDLSASNARQAIAAGCLLTVNCDAHHPEAWALLEYGIANARKAGARPENILNCWPLEKIESWLRDRDRGDGADR